MHNLVYLIGRLVNDPELKKTESNKDYTSINLAVQRSFKNSDGIYGTDFIKCILWNGIAQHTTDYCKKGDLVGIKGRIQTNKYEDENKKIHYTMDIIAERVTFLSSKRQEEAE